MTHYTTVEQSKKLLELGLSEKTADMVYLMYADSENHTPGFEGAVPMILRDTPINETNYPLLPSWSLGALLEILGSHIILSSDRGVECYWRCTDLYINDYEDKTIAFKGKTPMEAVYNMVVWCLENKWI